METSLVATWVVLVVCVGYGVAAWLVQMHRAAPPRDWLLGRIASIRELVASGAWGSGRPVEDDLARIERGVSKPWLFLSVSKVQAGWRTVHGLEDGHLLDLSPAVVEERLETARTRLKAIPGSESADLVKRIDAALKLHGPSRQHEAKAALLREAEIFRHDVNDSNYANLANLLGKAVWLTWAALALVVALAALFDRETFFLLGAAGGLMSRLTRVVSRRPKASDYGAEWSTLIVSPAAGALAGWLGVALVVALAGEPFNVFSDKLANPWQDATLPLGLALAFVFGFSERLFDRLVGSAVNQVAGELPSDGKKATTAATKTSSG